ncbi:SCO6745 family protein [Streptomyces sp. NPDC001665]
MSEDLMRVRQLWHLLEPVHAVLYYAPEAFEEAAALGYAVDERWPSYFAWRAAPLGPVGADRVGEAFYSFSPRMVGAYVPAVWSVASPDAVLAARGRAVDRTYQALLGDGTAAPDTAEAAALLRRVAEAAETADRPMAAANAALPWPDAPHLVLWHAATVLREHRGDGHLAALAHAELDPVEALVSFAAIGAARPEVFGSRGWGEGEWQAALGRLEKRGLVAADGTATEAGRVLRAEVERRTDEAAAGPWRVLTDPEREGLIGLLGPLWVAAIGSGLLPPENTLGIGKV